MYIIEQRGWFHWEHTWDVSSTMYVHVALTIFSYFTSHTLGYGIIWQNKQNVWSPIHSQYLNKTLPSSQSDVFAH